MVLYERNGTFIGIGKEELLFLGFEDFEEFKSEHKDFADLFVNRPGYIFKFKNFSWIDYTLHSGAPKKSVILRLKNGQEVETGIKISEIFLANPSENQNFYYGIEITNNTFQNQSFSPSSSPAKYEKPIKTEEPYLETATPMEPPLSTSTTLESDYIDESPSDELEELSTTFSSLNFDDEKEKEYQSDLTPKETNDFKLKIDDNVAEKLQEAPFNPSSNLDEDFYVKLKVNFENDLETSQPEIAIASLDDEQTFAEQKSSNEEFDFDLAQCAQDIGLDIPEIAELLEEYLKNIETSLDDIKKAVQDNNMQELNQLVIPLKGIADNLQIKQIAHSLEKMVSSSNDDKNSAYREFVHFVAKLKEELI